MLAEFARSVAAAAPSWWLIENVPGVPDVAIDTYTVQRFNILATEFGVDQRRNRCYQFGRRDGPPLTIPRRIESQQTAPAPAALAHDARHSWRQLAHLQGLPADFDLPGLSRLAKIRAIGNGVPVPVAAAIAAAIRDRHVLADSRRCLCCCGRVLAGKPAQISATAACRKRLERARAATAAASPPPSPSSIINRQSPIDNCAPSLST
jgi:DNA (cytosine-5)-methyltransferase 1